MKTPDTTDRLLEQRLRAWYRAEVGQDESAPLTLRRDIVAIPRWRVRRTGLFGRGRDVTLFAAAALLLVGGAAAASGLLRLPSLVPQVALPTFTPAPSQPAVATAPIPSAGVSPAPSGRSQPAQVAYIVGDWRTGQQLWIANMDGTGTHELLPGLAQELNPGLGGNQQAPVWSSDGTRLLFTWAPINGEVPAWGPSFGQPRFYLTDANGSAPQLVDTGCVAPCTGDSDAAFSRDGTHLVFVRRFDIPPASSSPNPATGKQGGPTPASILATIDLATGRVTELPSTTLLDCPLLPGQHAPGIPNCGGFANQHPRWSPDGTQIVFSQQVPYDINAPSENRLINGMPPPAHYPSLSLFVVDADGQNLHQISPCCGWAEWSPDGNRIVFDYWEPPAITVNPGRGTGYTLSDVTNIFTVQPDGSDLRQLTSDGVSTAPVWTADGQIWFGRDGYLWEMDADGSSVTQLSMPPLVINNWSIGAVPRP